LPEAGGHRRTEARSRARRKQLTDIRHNILETGRIFEIEAQPPDRVVDIGARRMIEDIAEFAPDRLLGTENAKFFGDRLDLPSITAQTEKRRMEPGHKTLQAFTAVAFRIKRHEQHLNLRRLLAQCLHDRRQTRQRGRADIRTRGVAEENNDDLAAKIGQRTPLTMVIAQFEPAAETGARQIGIAKSDGHWRRLAGGEQKPWQGEDEDEDEAAMHEIKY
jgi:hypothetical protein